MLWFEYCVSNGKRVICSVYSGYLEREKWRTSVLMGLRSIPVSKTRKVQHALHRSCLNKFTLSWETRVPRKTTFVTFFCSWNCLSNSKRLSLWQQEPSRQKWEEVWESRETLSVLCFRDARHVSSVWRAFSCDLHSDWNLAVLEYLFVPPAKGKCSVPPHMCGLFLSHLCLCGGVTENLLVRGPLPSYFATGLVSQWEFSFPSDSSSTLVQSVDSASAARAVFVLLLIVLALEF